MDAENLAKKLWWALKVDRAERAEGFFDSPNQIKQFCMMTEQQFMRAITEELNEYSICKKTEANS